MLRARRRVVHGRTVIHQVEPVAERAAQRVRTVAHHVGATATRRGIGRECGDDQVCTALERSPRDVNLALLILSIGQKVEDSPVVPSAYEPATAQQPSEPVA